jgi:hypothetical protein
LEKPARPPAPGSMKLRLLKDSSGVALFTFLFCACAQASGALEAGISPIAFNVELQLDYYVNNTPWGFNLGILSDGAGKIESARVRYYFFGHPQLASPSAEERKSAQILLEPKTRGLYIEGGLGSFQIDESIASSNGGTPTQQTTAGLGGIAAVGVEQPLFSNFFIGLRLTLFSSFNSTPVNPFFGEVLVGIPIGF